MALKKPEPRAGKLARTVLRRGELWLVTSHGLSDKLEPLEIPFCAPTRYFTPLLTTV